MFDRKVTLGNVLTIVMMMGGLVGLWAAISTQLAVQSVRLASIESSQGVIKSRMEDWYERLILLEERDRVRRGAPRR